MGIEHTNKERENFYGDPINVRMLHSTNFKEIFSQLQNIEKLHVKPLVVHGESCD